MMTKHPTQHREGLKRRVVRLLAPSLFLCSTLVSQAATNWVDGFAYGTDYSGLATAIDIASAASTNGSLVIGHEATTNLVLSHHIAGYVAITNGTSGFGITATGSSISNSQGYAFAAVNATNLTIEGGRFIGTSGSSGTLPPLPGGGGTTNITSDAMGGVLFNSTATVSGTEFAGSGLNDGLLMERSTLTVSNVTVRGGTTGAGLVAHDNSTVTIHSGTFTGGAGNTAFYLEDSDATVHDGTFTGNTAGTFQVAGDGLLSQLTGATTNRVSLYGGDFSSLAFYGTTGSVQHFLAGTNLVVQNGIIQSNGTVIVDNQSNDALQDIAIHGGEMVLSNDFTLASGGSLILDNDTSSALFLQGLELLSNSEVDIGLGQLEATGVLGVDGGATLRFEILSSNQYGTIVADRTIFGSNSTVVVDASLAGFSSGKTTNTLITTANGMYLAEAGSTNAVSDTTTFTNSVATDVRTTLDTNIVGRTTLEEIVVNNSLAFVFNTDTLSNYWDATGQLADLADELETIDNSTMNAIINNMGADASAAAVSETYFTSLNTFQTAMQGLHAAVGQAVSRGTEFRDGLNLPKGAKGPDETENNWRFWAKYYGQFYNRENTDQSAAYDATLHGGVIGMDKSFGPLLLGISGGMGNYRIESDNDSGQDMNAAHGALYSTIGKGHSYLDAGIAYGYNKVDSQTADPFVLNGEFDTRLISGYVGGGLGFGFPSIGTVITPEAGGQYTLYQQEAYTETSTTAVPRSFDEFDADSLRSSLGLNVAMLNTKAFETFSFKIEGRAHWLHEFNPEPGDLTFQLQGGTGNDYTLTYSMLDEDAARLGVGFSFFNTKKRAAKNVMLRLDFDELFGQDFNSHNLSAKAIYAF